MTSRLLRGGMAGLMVAAVLAFGQLQGAHPVSAASPAISLSRTTVPQGYTLTVNGSGFTSMDAILAYVDTTVNGQRQRAQSSGTSAGNGAFSLKLALPRFAAPTTYTVTARDTHGLSASQRLNVLPLIVLHAGSSGAGTTVTDRTNFFVDVLGMRAGEIVKIQATFPTYSGNQIVETRTPAATAQGSVYGVVLTAPRGAKATAATITATGRASNRQASGHVNVAYHPYVVIGKAVAPGSNLIVGGRGFVSNGQVRIQVTIKANDGTTPTLTVTATGDNNGNFTQALRIPSYAVSGTYTVVATDLSAGSRPSAKAIVSQFTYNATLAMLPNVTLPNEYVTLEGAGFPANTNVTVTSTINLRDGSTRALSKTVTTDKSGSFATDVLIPYRASPGTYSFTAAASSARASSDVKVLPLSSHPANLQFSWISLWYHTVLQGTWDYVTVQSTLHTQLGIWVHVIFPNGLHHDYYAATNGSGQWSVKFTVPKRSASRASNQAYITFQLWHGSQTAQSFMDFNLV